MTVGEIFADVPLFEGQRHYATVQVVGARRNLAAGDEAVQRAYDDEHRAAIADLYRHVSRETGRSVEALRAATTVVERNLDESFANSIYRLLTLAPSDYTDTTGAE